MILPASCANWIFSNSSGSPSARRSQETISPIPNTRGAPEAPATSPAQMARAVRKVGLKILVRPAEMADVGVGVDEAGRNHQPLRVEQSGGRPARMPCLRPDVAYSPVEHRDLHPFQYLSGIDIDHLPA